MPAGAAASGGKTQRPTPPRHDAPCKQKQNGKLQIAGHCTTCGHPPCCATWKTYCRQWHTTGSRNPRGGSQSAHRSAATKEGSGKVRTCCCRCPQDIMLRTGINNQKPRLFLENPFCHLGSHRFIHSSLRHSPSKMMLSRPRRLGALPLLALLLQRFVVVVHAFSISSQRPAVVCVGETLYDSLPEALFLGGAVTNVAVHLASLGVSSAGKSSLGMFRICPYVFDIIHYVDSFVLVCSSYFDLFGIYATSCLLDDAPALTHTCYDVFPVTWCDNQLSRQWPPASVPISWVPRPAAASKLVVSTRP